MPSSVSSGLVLPLEMALGNEPGQKAPGFGPLSRSGEPKRAKFQVSQEDPPLSHDAKRGIGRDPGQVRDIGLSVPSPTPRVGQPGSPQPSSSPTQVA